MKNLTILMTLLFGLPVTQVHATPSTNKPTARNSSSKPTARTTQKKPATRKASKKDEQMKEMKAWLKAASDSEVNLHLRIKSLEKLGKKREKAAFAAAAVLKLLTNAKPATIRQAAAFAAADVGADHPKTLPTLVKALQDKDVGVRECAASALGNLGKKAEKAVPALLKAASKNKGLNFLSISAWSFGNIGKADPTVIQHLLQLVKHKNKAVSTNARNALSRLGKTPPAPVTGRTAPVSRKPATRK